MATKKYVSLEKLSLYDEKIKKYLADADAASLQSAKDYADGLAGNYDAAGAADAALESAKSYADTEVAKANSAAAAAQADVDALEIYVGTIPEDYSESNVVAYVNKKAEETLASATGGSSESAASVLAALNTYKSENDPKVAANTTAAANAQTAADNAQKYAEGVAADLAAEVTNRTDADSALDTRIQTLEGQITGLSGAMHFVGVKESVPADVSDYSAGDVITVGEKEYVFNGTAFVEFGDVSAEGDRIKALEDDSHTHDNKSVLDSITEGNISSWNAAEQNAKDYADGLNTTMSTRMTTVETWQSEMVEVSDAEINALFA